MGIRPWECSHPGCWLPWHRGPPSGCVRSRRALLPACHGAPSLAQLQPQAPPLRTSCVLSAPKCALNSKAPSDARSQPPRCGGLNDLRPFLVSLSSPPPFPFRTVMLRHGPLMLWPPSSSRQYFQPPDSYGKFCFKLISK